MTKQRAAWIQSFLEPVYRKRGAQPALPWGKVSVGTSRDGENIERVREEPTLDVMKEDQRPTE
jgi:hypothetical protein